MQPGLNRAVPMALLGFLTGAALVLIVRGVQGLDPLWDVGPGILIGTLFTAGFFMWGMGAFDPSMSVHGEEAEHIEEPETEQVNYTAPASKLLSGSIWQIVVLLSVSIIILFIIAASGLVTLRTTADPLASATEVGYFPVTWFGRDLLISELLVFIVFIAIIILSLIAAAGGLGWLFIRLSDGLKEVRTQPNAANAASSRLASAPASAQLTAPIPGRASPTSASNAGTAVLHTPAGNTGAAQGGLSIASIARMVVTFVIVALLFYVVLLPITISHAPEYITPLAIVFGVLAAIFVGRPAFLPKLVHMWALIFFVFGILYFIFYEVAIGLVLAQPYELRVILSLVNAFLIAVLLVRPSWIVRIVTGGAGILARFLRRVPDALQ